MMETLLQDLRYALRMFVKSPGFTIVAVLSLALGIGANTTIFTVINAILLNPLPVKDISRLVDLSITDKQTTVTAANTTKLGMSFQNYKDFRDQNDVFSGLAVFSFAALTLSGKGDPKQVTGLLVSANYFDVLGVQPARGRFFYPDEDRKRGGNPVAVISYGFWAKHLGSDPNIIGKNITLNAQSYTVIGVTPRNFKSTVSFLPPDIAWIPTSMSDQALTGVVRQFFDERRALVCVSFGRLKPGIGQREAEAAMQTIAGRLEREYPKENHGRSVALSPLADAAVGVNQHSQFALIGALLMTVVGLVLLIACANLANLLLSQAARRETEMSVRAALGASPRRLMRQLFTESILLSLLGGVAGLLIAYWGRDVLWSFRPSFLQQNSIDLSLDARVLSFTLAVSLLTGLLFGLFPAFKASRIDLNEALKVGGRGGTVERARNRFRSALVVTEIGLALVALVGAGLFIRSMQYAQRIDPGFESKKLFAFAFDLDSQHYQPEQGQQFYNEAIAHAIAVPGVEAATVASNAPLGGGFLRTVFREGEQDTPGQRGTLTTIDAISPSFFETLRIPLLRGRQLSDSDRENTPLVAVARQARARHFWPNEDAVGKRFTFFGEKDLRQIVGIVRDTAVNAIGEEPQPVVYLPLRQNYSAVATLQVRTAGKPEAVLGTVRNQVQALDRNLALTNLLTIDEILNQGLWAPRMGAALLSLFAALALVLAMVGIYGVMAYSVTQRTHEIGIRMALGAQQSDVLRLVVRQGMTLALTGVISGLAVAFALTRGLNSLLFGVTASDPMTFVGVTLLVVAVTLLASYIPARRAMQVDPIVALRYE
jgi:predicted permease